MMDRFQNLLSNSACAATKWVADIAARFLQKDFVKVDMVGRGLHSSTYQLNLSRYTLTAHSVSHK